MKHNLPQLLITEVVVDSEKDTETESDLYNFFEVYNNTESPILLSEINIRFRTPSRPHTDKVWHPKADGAAIPPGKPMVFWLIGDAHATKTVADFNAKYGCDLIENETIVRLPGRDVKKMAAKQRAVVIATNSGYEIAVAQINANSWDVAYEKSITYKYPEDGGNGMVKISCKEESPTPGTVGADQVPARLLPSEDAPLIRNLTRKIEVLPLEKIEIAAEIANGVLVKGFSLYYKGDMQTEFSRFALKVDLEDGVFRHTIEPVYFLGSDSLSYYFVAIDGGKETRSETYTVSVVREPAGTRLNLQDNDVISGLAVIKAVSGNGSANNNDPSGIQLFLDGEEPGSTFRCLDNLAFFVFETIGVNKVKIFKNSVLLGDEIYEMLNYQHAGTGCDTIIVPVDPDKLHHSGYSLTIRAGSREHAVETRTDAEQDQFSVRNVRLHLANGHVVKPKQLIDSGEEVQIGSSDHAEQSGSVNFTFDIPQEQLLAKACIWDTTTVSDGEHRIYVAAPGQENSSVSILVDNSGPVIHTSIEEGKPYRGQILIEVTAEDKGAGLEELEVTLDGAAIAVPYSVFANKLGAGNHPLRIAAKDKAGNETVVNRGFVVALPDQPNLISPREAAVSEINPSLQVKVTDPLQDELKVTFLQGYKYTAANTDNVRVYRNATAVEPPNDEIPAGEIKLTTEELASISSLDNPHFTVDSEQFPYVRFDVQLTEPYDNHTRIELLWEGKSLPGRKVTMYAWNFTQKGWKPLDSFVAHGEEEFSLTGKIGVSDFVKDNRVNILVQDLIETKEDFDFTIVLVPDTQMYSMAEPDTYDELMKWIVQQEEHLKIRYVVHVGDIVDLGGVDYQWVNADRSMRILDESGIPYGVLCGNHDANFIDVDFRNYLKYFGAHRYEDRKYYGGSFKDNRGHYDLISIDGIDFIFVYMGWSDNWTMWDDEIEWIHGVLAEHRNRKAILVVHDYLVSRGERSEKGNYVYQKVVVPNSNIIMTLNGHTHGSALIVDELDDNGDGILDRKVNQICGTKGIKQGYMTLLHFDKANHKVYAKVYSPTLDKYNANFEWTLDMNLEPQVKRVATNYFEARVYTDKRIGEVENVSSGSTVNVTWEGLKATQAYSWYVRTEDSQGGTAVSSLQSFTV